MAGKQKIIGNIVTDYLKKYPDMPALTLAKKIKAENKELPNSVDSIRTLIRFYTGNLGEKDKRQIKDKSFFREKRDSTPPKFPESKAENKAPWKLPKSIRKVLLLSDIHIPYHDVDAVKAAVKYGKEQGVDCVYLNGDILDMYQLSTHEKDPRKTSLAGELEAAREFLAWLRYEFPTETIYFITGNHEYRMERYLFSKAKELLGLDEYKLEYVLRLHEHKIINIPHRSKVYFGKLLVEHGDKMMGSGGVNPARTLLLKFKRPIICGHFHRTSAANGKIYDGDSLMAWSTGSLCELEPSYMEVNEWNHGAAIIEVDTDGKFRVDNFQVINGKVY